MADTRTIWIQVCIDAIKARASEELAPEPEIARCDEYGQGILEAASVLEKMLTAEPAGDSGITVDGAPDHNALPVAPDVQSGAGLVDALCDAGILKRSDDITGVEIKAFYDGILTMVVHRYVGGDVLKTALQFTNSKMRMLEEQHGIYPGPT